LPSGLVIRRQRLRGKVVFITLEDELGHIHCMAFPDTYRQNELTFKQTFLVASGYLSRKDGACNIVIQRVEALSLEAKVPASRDWR